MHYVKLRELGGQLQPVTHQRFRYQGHMQVFWIYATIVKKFFQILNILISENQLTTVEISAKVEVSKNINH